MMDDSTLTVAEYRDKLTDQAISIVEMDAEGDAIGRAAHCLMLEVRRLRAQLAARDRDAKQRLTALRLAYGALLQCSPCAEPECKAVQSDWIATAMSSISAAIDAAMATPQESP
jgi:hypothetical protein